jgi:hypothetical protein
MRAEAEPNPHRRRNESACGAPVAHFDAWVGPLLRSRCEQNKSRRRMKLLSSDTNHALHVAT